MMASCFFSSQKKVLFIHKGVSFGRFVLFVSDGKHYVSTLLEVIILFFVLFFWFNNNDRKGNVAVTLRKLGCPQSYYEHVQCDLVAIKSLC